MRHLRDPLAWEFIAYDPGFVGAPGSLDSPRYSDARMQTSPLHTVGGNVERVTSVSAGDLRSPDSGKRREGLVSAGIQAGKDHPGKLLAVEDEISPFVIEGSCRSSSNDFVDVLALMF